MNNNQIKDNNTVPNNDNINNNQNSNVVSNTEGMNNSQVQNNNDSNVNLEKKEDTINIQKPMKEVTIDPDKSTGNGKYILTGILFVGLLLMVVFLPDISAFITEYRAGNQPEEVITTGTLKCTLDRISDNYDIHYEQLFSFTDNKLDKLVYTVETRGDMNLDAADLDNKNTKCEMVSAMSKNIDGFSVKCELLEGTITETHTFVYSEIDSEQVNSAYIEAGGVYQEYQNKQDMDEIEKSKNQEGFSCIRVK